METSGSNLIILWTNIYRAEAEKMRMKASAYKQYGDAAILSLVLEALPQVRLSVSLTICNTSLHWLLGFCIQTFSAEGGLIFMYSISEKGREGGVKIDQRPTEL